MPLTLAKLHKRLSDLAARADDLSARMDAVADRYVEGVAAWAADRFRGEVAEVVSAAPDVTHALGADGLSRLKADLDRLVGSLPDLARRRVGTSGAWPHRLDRQAAELPAGAYGAGEARGQVIPGFLEIRLRVLLGAAGHLLARHGFEAYVRRHWDRRYVRSDYFPPEYLARDLDGHEQFRGLVAEYADLYDEYVEAVAGLLAAEAERATAEAKELWAKA